MTGDAPAGVTERRARGGSTAATTASAPLGIVECGALLAVVLVAATATASLALAQAGHHDGLVATLLGVLATAAAAGLAWTRGRPELALDGRELALLAVTAVASALMFLPGFPYAYGDKDPGVYVSHAFAIAREGSVEIDDDLVATGLPVESLTPGARFPGLWVDPDEPTVVTPQFYHLYPALLATAVDLVGPPGAWHLNPALAGLSVLVLALAARRAAGWTAAAVVVALHVAFMPQVWQSRYPSTEVLAQLLLNGAILAGVIAIARRSRWGAAAGGALVGTGFLARPDGLLYVALALGILGALAALRRLDAVGVAALAGLAASLPYALWNAFAARAGYTEDNGVPDLPIVAAATVAGIVVVGALALVPRLGHVAGGWLARERVQRVIGAVVVVVFGALLVAFWHRETLLGVDHTYFGSQRIRSYDESNLHWLAFFLFVPGLVAAWLGLAVVVLRRWRWELLLVVGPGLVLLPVYLWEAKISPRLMWWVRRFVPGVIPALLVLIAVLGAWLLTHPSIRRRLAGGLAVGALTVAFATQSLPLREHREMGGSYDTGASIAALAGDRRGVFLFTRPLGGIYDPNRNLPGPLWFIHDQLAGYLPEDGSGELLERVAAAFEGSPVFVVTPPDTLPTGLAQKGLTRVLQLRRLVSLWEESATDRPNEQLEVPVDVDVWRMGG